MKRYLKRLRVSRGAVSPVDHRGLGDAARASRDWVNSAFHYRAHVSTQPDDFDIWVQLGHALKEAGDIVAADHAYATAAKLNDQDADLFLNRGHLAKLRQDLASAAGFYHMSHALDGNAHAARELNKSDIRNHLAERGIGVGGRMVGALDQVNGSHLVGWAFDPDFPDVPAEIEVLIGTTVIATATANEYRQDGQIVRLADADTGFRINLSGLVDLSKAPSIGARLKRTGEPLTNSPIVAEPSLEARYWLGRHDGLSDADRFENARRVAAETQDSVLSIVMPVYNTPGAWLREALDSVLSQTCGSWELICVNDASPDPSVSATLAEYAARDTRLRILDLDRNGGISRATNAGLRAAKGEYVALMDHDDVLEPEAVFRLLDAARTGAGLIYSDEIITSETVTGIEHFAARCAFSHDYYLAHPYFVHMVCVRRELALEVGGFDEGMLISADVDFVLRIIERAEAVAHVPAFLYRWRTHGSSAGHSRQDQVTAATVEALNRHLARLNLPAVARPGVAFNVHKIEWQDDQGRTLIIIPTKDGLDLLKPCVESILATTDRSTVDILIIDHESKKAETRRYLSRVPEGVRVMPYSGVFNFSRMNNIAAQKFGGEYKYIVFMNNDIEAIEPGWLESMRSLAGRPSVGAVGATLLYDDRRVQHSGVIVGIGGSADHGHKFVQFESTRGTRTLGYNCSLVCTRDYSAVTAACLMVRADVFFGIDGYDEDLVIGFNDTDLCLRISSLGYKILNDADAVLYHHESATRSKTDQIDHPADGGVFVRRWADFLAKGDPFYSPLLSLKRDHIPGDFSNHSAGVRVMPTRSSPRPLREGRPRKISHAVDFHGVATTCESVSVARESRASNA